MAIFTTYSSRTASIAKATAQFIGNVSKNNSGSVGEVVQKKVGKTWKLIMFFINLLGPDYKEKYWETKWMLNQVQNDGIRR